MRARVVPELDDEWMGVERPLNHRALHTLTAAVDQPHLAKARLVRRAHVLLHNVHDITRCEGVQVEKIFDRDLVHGANVT